MAVITGDATDNILVGTTEVDQLAGLAGNDILTGGADADTLDGGDGSDTASYSGSAAGVTVSLVTNTGTGGDAEGDTLSSIENLTGSDFDDTLTGDAGSNALDGGGGNDTLIGGAGADALDGGADTDTASYAGSSAGVTVNLATGAGSGGDAQGDTLSSIENLTGSDNNDTLIGDAAANVLDGGAGDDTLIGGGGADTLIGGDGVDTASYATSATNVNVYLDGNYGPPGGMFGDAQGDTLSGIENLTGSAFNDGLFGDAGNNVLNGGGGDDNLIGGAGADTVIGGDGTRDTATYAGSSAGVTVNLTTNQASGGDAEGDTLSGIENLTGSAFDDTLTGDGNVNAFMGGAGADTIDGGGNNDTVQYVTSASAVTVNLVTNVNTGGDAEGDHLENIENLVGSNYDDTLTGNASANILTGNDGNDTLNGGDGNDTLHGGNDADTLNGDGGSDTLNGGAGADILNGGDANDTLNGEVGADTLNGGEGNDTLNGGADADILTGGNGTDSATYAGSSAGVTVDLLAGTGTGGHAEGDTLDEIENLIGSSHADSLTGDDGANVLRGGGGADTLVGGDGIDTASYTNSAAVNVSLTTNTGTGGDAQGDTLNGIENLSGSSFNDTLTGDAGSNRLDGGEGSDTLEGMGGADDLRGGNGIDTASYEHSAGGVSVNLATGAVSGGDAAGDTFDSIENILGSAGDDTITGNSGNNRLDGGLGNDTIDGGQGDDRLVGGGGGADQLTGGDGSDWAEYGQSGSGVTVDLGAGTGLGGDAQGDTLNGIENLLGSAHDDILTGNGGANIINGGQGDDIISTGDGDDTLIGGGGADELTGGDGEDTADYSGSPAAVNVNLTTGLGSGGDAEGDTLDDIENVIGSNHNDTLTGDAGVNELYGGSGNDLLEGMGGADKLVGGSGIDTASYASSDGSVIVDLVAGTGLGGHAHHDTLSEIENLIGSTYDDDLTGNSLDNNIQGGNGNDAIRGGDGNDTLGGGSGNDIIEGGTGTDILLGGSGEDHLDGGTGNDTLDGGEGDDALTGGAGADQLIGGSGTDVANYIASSAGVNVNLDTGIGSGGDAEGDTLTGIEALIGSTHDDILTGNAENNVIVGGGGNDIINGGSGGSDTVSYATATAGVTVNLQLNTGSGNDAEGDTYISIENVIGSGYGDIIIGGSSANATLNGGSGNDTIVVNAANTTIIGGDGTGDTVSYANASAGVTVNLQIGTGGDGDTYVGIENVIGSSHGDIIYGGATATASVLDGGDGEDVIVVNGSNVSVIGGDGDDTVSYANASAGVTVNLQLNEGGAGGGDTYIGIENVIGSGHGDIIIGGSNADATLNGDGGNDTIVVNAANTTVIGGAGSDTVSYASAAADVTVDLQLNEGGDGDTYVEIENVIGSGFDDIIIGGASANASLDGGDGDDVIVVNAANTTVIGGDGDGDTVSYANAAAGVTVNLQAGTSSNGDTLIGIENIVGSGFDDIIIGGSSANATLSGGNGNDTIVVNAANTEVDGGDGSDTVSYASAAAGVTVDLQLNAGGNGDTYAGIENVIGSGFGDIIVGGANAGASLDGGDGDDTIVVNAANTAVDGGDGDGDTVSYAGAAAGVTINLQTGLGGNGDTYAGIENAIGSGFDDIIIGGSSANATLEGGDGNDNIVVNAANTTVRGGAGSDSVSYAGAAAGVTIDLLAGEGGNGDSYADIENVVGSSHNDIIIGGSTANATLEGGDGNDTIVVNAANTTVRGGAGSDSVSYAEAAAGVTINLQINKGGAGNNDTYVDIENVVGSEYGDIIIGSSTAGTTLNGGGGDDVIEVNAGNTTVIGGSGSNTVSYAGAAAGVTINLIEGESSTNDTYISIRNVIGSSHNDIIIGSSEANATLDGDDGDDTIVVNGANTTVIGGGGNNTVSYAGAAAGVTINLIEGEGGETGSGTDTYANIRNVIGSGHGDIIIGSSEANATLNGGGGNDIIQVNGANTTVYGGDGSDTVSYAAAAAGVTINLQLGSGSNGATYYDIENVIGSNSGDIIIGSSTANTSLNGGSGNDTIRVNAGNTTVIGGDGDDTVSYAGASAGVIVNLATGNGGDGSTYVGIENVVGSGFDDLIVGGSSASATLNGGDGNDTIVVNAANTTVTGGAGSDTVSYAAAAAGVTVNLQLNAGGNGDTYVEIENVIGSGYGDLIIGGASANATLNGGNGDDTIVVNAANTTVIGGGGSDTVSYASASAGVTVNLQTGAGSDGSTYVGIENVVGSGYGDIIVGGSSAGATLDGGDGDDTIVVNAANTTVIGGSGTDTVSFAQAQAYYTVTVNGDGTYSITGGEFGSSAVTLNSIENLQFADGAYNPIIGTSGNDTITGTEGNDIIDGQGGNDTINALGGNDLIIASSGVDTISGGNGTDVLDYSSLTVGTPWSGLFIAMHVNDVRYYAAGQMQVKDNVTGIEHFIATSGNDWMYGSGGDEIFEGGAGVDIFDGAGGSDTLSYVHSSAGVNVNLATGAASGGDAQGDHFLGGYTNPVDGSGQGAGGAANLWGSAHADILTGNSGTNLLRGNAGNDILRGNGGNDTLEGGAGSDAAYFDDFIDGYTISYNSGVITVTSNGGIDGTDTLTGIETLVFAGISYDFTNWTGGVLPAPSGGIFGTEGDDILYGTAGDDGILALGGNDQIYLGNGNDRISGGAGIDRIDYSGYTVASGWGGLRFNTQQNTVDMIQSGVGWVVKDRFSSIEVITGTTQDDWFAGSGSVSEIWEGGAGADVFDGNGGEDTVSYEHSSAGVNINLTAGTASGGDAQGDIIAGSYTVPGAGGGQTIGYGLTHVWGSAHADTLTGNSLSQLLRGNAGNDILRGEGGNDTLEGGEGTDTAVYALGFINYTVSYSNGAITVTANSGTEGIDTLTGIEYLQFGDTTYDFTGWTGGSIGGGTGGEAVTISGDNNANTIYGTAGHDVIAGLGGDDTIYGLGGNDILNGGHGLDTLDGGDGEDWVSYADFDQPHPGYGWGLTVSLAAGTALRWGQSSGQSYYILEDNLSNIENIRGSAYGEDSLTGNALDNKLEGGAGGDHLYGGAGSDWAVYEHSTAGVSVNLTTGAASGGDAAGDTFSDIENLWGSANNDALTGNALANILNGRAGDDTLSGGDGDDTLVGEAGGDSLSGGSGRDWASYAGSSAAVSVNLATGAVSGGDAAGDTFSSIENLRGSSNADSLTGDAGDNFIEGGAGSDVIDGGAGNDTADYALSTAGVTVNLATNLNTGGDAQGDTLTNIENLRGSAHADTLTGDAGNNLIEGGAGADIIDGGSGNDWALYNGSAAGVTVNLLTGVNTDGDAQGDTLTGIENLHGSAFDDTLTGDAGSNILNGGRGVDTLDGGDGEDWVSYVDFDLPHPNSSEGVAVNLSTGTTTRQERPQGQTYIVHEDYLANIENVRGSVWHDALVGNALDNKLEGGAGNDSLNGGAGNDWAVYEHSAAGVSVNLATGVTSGGDAAGDTFSSIENLSGSAHADTLTGDGLANVLRGGAGADTLNGGTGSDWADYTGSAAVSVNLATGAISGGDAQGDTLISIENLRGSDNADMLTGDAGDNYLDGGLGADTLNGGAGDDTADYKLATAAVTVNLTTGIHSGAYAAGDTLINIESLRGSAYGDTLTGNTGDNKFQGGAGADVIDGGAGNDWSLYNESATAVTVNLATGVNTGGDAAGDTLTGIENLHGSAFDDMLTGDAGSNILNGGRGVDTLDGGDGEDWVSYEDFDQPHPNGWGLNVNLSTGVAYRWIQPSGQSYLVLEDNLSNIENIRGSVYGDETLIGNGLDNKLEGGGGGDSLQGGGGSDWAVYEHSSAGVSVNLATATASGGDAAGDSFSSIENLWGSAFADTLTGDGTANILNGRAGNDTLTGGGGDDFIDGGDGIDTAIYAMSSSNYTISSNAGTITVTATSGNEGTDTLTNVEKLVFNGVTYDFTGGSTSIVGDANANTITGTAGNDTIDAKGGNDTINALGGNDLIIGGAGADTINGGDGFDTVDYSGYLAPVSGWQGLLFDLANSKVVQFDNGWVQKDAYQGVENLVGTSVADWFMGSAGVVMEGGAGADIYDTYSNTTVSYAHSSAGVNVNLTTGAASGGDAQGDVLKGSYTAPTGGNFNINSGGPGHVWGSAHADILTGNANTNELKGGGGNDTLNGLGGNDTIDGGSGTDSALYNLIISSYTIGYSNGAITVTANSGSEGTDTLTGVEKLVFNGITYDFTGWTGGTLPTPENAIYGTEGNDILNGTAGNDPIFALGGNDTIAVSNGKDAINGGDGFDTLDYSGYLAPVGGWNGLQIDVTNNNIWYADSYGFVLKDTIQSIESIIGTSAQDWFTSSVAVVMEGGAGADIYDAYGNTTVSYVHSSAGVNVNLQTGAASGGDAQGDVLKGTFVTPGGTSSATIGGGGPGHIWGSAHADTLTGNANANELKGNGGNDTLTGGDGSDTYLIGRGDGIDNIVQAGISDAAGTTDIVKFSSGVAFNQLWFSQQGDDLRIDVIGEGNSSVLLEDWYSDATRRVDSIQTADGNHSLSAANVQALVDAMASYSAPASGQFTLDPQVANDLSPVFATTWA